MALKQNPLPIALACHRVIYQSGALGGYAFGVERKTWLLHHERNSSGAPSFHKKCL
ncbi:MAG: methylated-DNA--[protein]-cysteine S-methyltransferase [Deltaproteobacteria bacterium]|nr:methylated-DNA--[protein]-cysteine S-methyltransferase [Deltaproteobacteria bacterium]